MSLTKYFFLGVAGIALTGCTLTPTTQTFPPSTTIPPPTAQVETGVIASSGETTPTSTGEETPPSKENPTTLSGDCPSLQRGFQSLDRAILTPIQEASNGTIFEVLCESERETNFNTRLETYPRSFRSIVWYEPTEIGSIKTLPVFASISDHFQKYIVGSDFRQYLIGISPESTKDRILLDILTLDDLWNPTKIGQIEPNLDTSTMQVYPEGIAYFNKENTDLHLFSFASKKDTLIAKNVVQFLAIHHDGRSKVFGEGWNILYYSYPDGVGGTVGDESKFVPKWVDVKFSVYKDGKSVNALTLSRQTRLEGGIGDPMVVLDSELVQTRGTNTETLLYFGPHQIQ